MERISVNQNALHMCPIWPQYQLAKRESPALEDETYCVSPRSGGRYVITDAAEEKLRFMGDGFEQQRIKARLTTILDELRRDVDEWPMVTGELIDRAISRRDLHPFERANRLLGYLAAVPARLGVEISPSESQRIEMQVRSESINFDEVVFLIRYLQDRGYVDARITDTQTRSILLFVCVTIQGHARVAETMQATDPAQAFVAMWFDRSVDGLYERGIRPAIEAAGYKPLRIDQKPDANKIDDEIIAEIRRSRFVVADFTHGEGGARGGVYYEAGFAYGLNIPVIFTCREDMFDNIHFDTRQYNHIGWAEPDDLVEPLKQRILARIGEGPNRQ